MNRINLIVASRRIRIFAVLACSFLLLKNEEVQAAPELRVSENGRFLEYKDGRPFFYLGDTAWELFDRLDREEADLYLRNRAEKGFTVIQAVVIAQFGGRNTPNAYGNPPLVNNDPLKPNEEYFGHVDYIVNRAEELGLFIGMLPAWGGHWKFNGNKPGLFTDETALEYGRFLGKRYRDKPIIWILGGDENATTAQERSVIAAMARGLDEGDGGAHLMTFHPRGPGFSSYVFHSADWLDFNMCQSSHGSHDHDNGMFAEHDYALQPAKPTLDGEPRYECMPVGFYFQNFNRYDRFTDYDARQAAYWSLLAGACGHTYGNNNIWQMWEPGRPSVIFADVPWYEALDHPGAFQMGHLRRLFESRPFNRLVPDQSLVLVGPTSGGAKIRAAIANDASFAFIYSPQGEAFTVECSRLGKPGVKIKEMWFNPKYGTTHHVHTTDTPAIQTYTPPTSGRDQDWLLILEREDAGYPLPSR